MRNQLLLKSLVLIALIPILSSRLLASHTANKVSYEFHPRFYRIYIQYTVPALKEFREATIDLTNKKQAEYFFWSLVRGAHFTLESNKVEFLDDKEKQLEPW